LLAQQMQVNHPRRVVGKNELAPIPTLRHVVRNNHHNYPRQSRYGQAQYQKTPRVSSLSAIAAKKTPHLSRARW